MMLFLVDRERDSPGIANSQPHVDESRPRPPFVIRRSHGARRRRASPPRHDVDRTGQHGEASDRGSKPGLFECEPLDLEHQLGRRRQCIPPALHRQRARVPGLAAECPRACSAR